MPVRPVEAPVPPPSAPPRPVSCPAPAPVPMRTDAGLIEIEPGDGRRVRVGADVNLGALRRVLAALRG